MENGPSDTMETGVMKNIFRALRRWGPYVFAIIPVIAGVAGIHYVGLQYYERLDLTEDQRFSPEETLLEELRNLETEVSVYFFPLPDSVQEGHHTRVNRRAVRDLLMELDRRSERLNVRIYPDHTFSDRIRTLANAHDIPGDRLLGQEPILVAGPAGHRLLRFSEFIAPGIPGGGPGQEVTISYATVQQLLESAIVRVTRENRPVICFGYGFGEGRIDREGEGEGRFSAFARRLEDEEGYDVRAHHWREEQTDACDVWIAAGPEQPYTRDVRERIRNHLESGGSLLVFAGPDQETGLASLLRTYGIVPGDGRVRDPENRVPGVPGGPVEIRSFGDHPVSDPLRATDVPVYMKDMRKISPGNRSNATVLLRTRPGATLASGETQTQEEMKGIPIGVASSGDREQSAPGRRILMIGSSSWLENSFLSFIEGRTGGGNVQLAINTVRWAVGDIGELEGEPVVPDRSVVTVTRADADRVFALTALILPSLILILGISAWWFRRLLR